MATHGIQEFDRQRAPANTTANKRNHTEMGGGTQGILRAVPMPRSVTNELTTADQTPASSFRSSSRSPSSEALIWLKDRSDGCGSKPRGMPSDARPNARPGQVMNGILRSRTSSSSIQLILLSPRHRAQLNDAINRSAATLFHRWCAAMAVQRGQSIPPSGEQGQFEPGCGTVAQKGVHLQSPSRQGRSASCGAQQPGSREGLSGRFPTRRCQGTRAAARHLPHHAEQQVRDQLPGLHGWLTTVKYHATGCACATWMNRPADKPSDLSQASDRINRLVSELTRTTEHRPTHEQFPGRILFVEH